jgi:hypothetical protein
MPSLPMNVRPLRPGQAPLVALVPFEREPDLRRGWDAGFPEGQRTAGDHYWWFTEDFNAGFAAASAIGDILVGVMSNRRVLEGYGLSLEDCYGYGTSVNDALIPGGEPHAVLAFCTSLKDPALDPAALADAGNAVLARLKSPYLLPLPEPRNQGHLRRGPAVTARRTAGSAPVHRLKG